MSISEFTSWRRYSLLSRSTQLISVISPHACACVRHKGSEGDAASRPAALLGEEHDWGILSTVERTFFFFSAETVERDHCEKGGIKI